MQPTHHESALAAFFRRHALVAPLTDADGLIERLGLVLAMGFAMREAEFRAEPVADDGCRFGRHVFPVRDWMAASGEGHRLAHLINDIAAGRYRGVGGFRALVDFMALTMRRLGQAGIPVTPDVLAQEGFTAEQITEAGFEAAQLAEAMDVAMRRYRKSRAAEPAREAA